MTETTETKAALDQETQRITNLIQSDIQDAISHLFTAGIDPLIIGTIANVHTCLAEELELTQAKVTSLTKERDELKSKIDSNDYYCTKCSDCNWEGSSKFLRVSKFDECDISCPCCHSNNLDDSNKALNDDQSISNLRDYIDMQAFRLSKAEEENKELKEALKKISELEHQAAEPFSICDADYNYVADQDRIIVDAKNIALSSLQSKGEE
jgi:Zn finger protein HypA/HybF involved in hydrogenase expression